MGTIIFMLMLFTIVGMGYGKYLRYFFMFLFLLLAFSTVKHGDDWSFPWWFWVFVVFCVLLGISSEITDRKVKKEREKFLKEIEQKRKEKEQLKKK